MVKTIEFMYGGVQRNSMETAPFLFLELMPIQKITLHSPQPHLVNVLNSPDMNIVTCTLPLSHLYPAWCNHLMLQ